MPRCRVYEIVDGEPVQIVTKTNNKKNNKNKKRKRDNNSDDSDDSNKKRTSLNPWDAYKYNDVEISELETIIEKYSHNNSNMLGWVSASKTKNYLLDDPCIDWLTMYYKKYGITDGIMTRRRKEILSKESSNYKSDTTYHGILFDCGNIFESKIYDELKYVHDDKFTLIFDREDYEIFRKDYDINGHIRDKYNETLNAMKNHVPIIAQGVVINDNNKTYGIADLIVRSDMIDELFNMHTPDDLVKIGAPKIGAENFHYRIIDCKWSTLPLCTDGESVRNSGRFKTYKGQIAVYTGALGEMQGYYPGYGYIMGKAWNVLTSRPVYRPEGVTSKYRGYSAFDKAGIIDFYDKDRGIIQKTKKAIQWLQRCMTEGSEWRYGNKPSVMSMYPNMCNKDMIWQSVKNKLAKRYGEITQLWYANPYNREVAFSNGVYDINDPNISPTALGCTSQSRSFIQRDILDINKKDQVRDLVRPSIIETNTYKWQAESMKDYYIDFEMINPSIYKNPYLANLDNSYNGINTTFMIGFGFETLDNINTKFILDSLMDQSNNDQCRYIINNDPNNKKWEFVCLYIDRFSVINEIEIFRLFFSFIVLRSNLIKMRYNVHDNVYSRLFHWSGAEKNSINDAIKKMRNPLYKDEIANMFDTDYNTAYRSIRKVYSEFGNEAVFIDMCNEVRTEPIVVKGSYAFNLKGYANAFYANGLTNTHWTSSTLSNGFEAMMCAIGLYKNAEANNTEIYDTSEYKEILEYNEIDCKVMWEIVSYLRENHTLH
jgi:hypothetical protein